MKLCAATITVLLVGLLEPCLSFPPAADAPFSNSPNSFGALYEGSHEGDAYTLSETDTDSRGIGSAAMQGGLAGPGKLHGAVLTGGPGGNKGYGTTDSTLSARSGSISGGSLSSAPGLGWYK
uniref:Male reproductive-related protein A n=1 Tax=Macrobrachium rosenbergii TaxID=79674 RepID=B8LG24_MACRS|nr:male reproductive-related protein A [Macrobrachium rosenbergii]